MSANKCAPFPLWWLLGPSYSIAIGLTGEAVP